MNRQILLSLIAVLALVSIGNGQTSFSRRESTRGGGKTRPAPRVIEPALGAGTVAQAAYQVESLPPNDEGPSGEAQLIPATGGSDEPPRSPFGPEQTRLPMLDSSIQPLGRTPRPTHTTQVRYDQYVAGTIDPDNTLDVVLGRPRILIFREPPARIQIADENTARVTVISEKELSVDGIDVGTTVLNLWFGPKEEPEILSYLVRVIPDPEQRERLERVYAALSDEINRTFPDSVVRLSVVGDKVVVSGQAKDVVEAAQILRVVAANAPGGGRAEVATEEIPVSSINVFATPDQTGSIPEQGLQNFLLRDIGRNVINLLEIPGEQQVMLRVTVAEVNRAAARSIGVDFSILNNAGTAVFSSLTGGLLPTAISGGGSSASVAGGNLPVSLDNGQVFLAIQALRNLNLARSLAEPTLTTLNGQPANFRAGGEFPVPAATQSFGGVGQGVAFIPFGVQLQFLPYITDRDRIRLQIGASVSTRDPSLGTNVGGAAIAGGTSVSGLSSRTFQTSVELREGQTLAVAGLIQNNFGATTVRTPLLGDWPVVGNFFGRNSSSSAEQELVILVTPELVHPLEACDTPPLPGADVFEPGDIELYLLGRLESRRAEDFRASVRTDIHRIRRYNQCNDLFIIGPTGQSHGCCDARRAGEECAVACPPNVKTDNPVTKPASVAARDQVSQGESR